MAVALARPRLLARQPECGLAAVMDYVGRDQLVAVLVMLLELAFLTVITAPITSTLVARTRRAPSAVETGMAEQLRQLDSRLERIEAALNRSSSP